MKETLKQIRQPEKGMPAGKAVIHTLLILALGIGLGLGSKWLDGSPELPGWMEFLDMGNFFGRLAVWLAIAICIAGFSNSAARAAVNVFLFFGGMVAAYYLYSKLIAGFFPRSYAMIWVGLTVLSPLLAALTWYSRGSGRIAVIVSGAIIGCLAWTTVHIDLTYISVTSALDLMMVAAGIAVLGRKNWKEFLVMLGIGVLTLLVFQNVIPFSFW